MLVYQMTGRGGGVRESNVKWSGKNEFWVREKSVKCQGISFQTKSGHPDSVGDLSSILSVNCLQNACR